MTVTYLPVRGTRRRKGILKAVNPDGTALVIDARTRHMTTCRLDTVAEAKGRTR